MTKCVAEIHIFVVGRIFSKKKNRIRKIEKHPTQKKT